MFYYEQIHILFADGSFMCIQGTYDSDWDVHDSILTEHSNVRSIRPMGRRRLH